MNTARRRYIARKAEEIRREGTSVCDAINLILERLNTLGSDELYARPGHPGGLDTDRIPAEYRIAYRMNLERALALLVEVEDRYLRQRADCRRKRHYRLNQTDASNVLPNEPGASPQKEPPP